jgi:serine/threonine-protein kinase
MTDPAAAGPGTARDEQLALLLEELTQQLRQGRQPDLGEMTRRYPGLADELRELWAAAQIAEEFVRPAPDPQATVAQYAANGPLSPVPAPILPRKFGDYELLEEVGRGGMGVVYKARQASLARTVAIKMILRGPWASVADLARFRAEAESAARLEHAHIVPVYEVGECDGQAYFSMKYVEGRTLAQLVAEGPLPPRQAAESMIAICRAVHHAHQQGVLHRDLKPSNVLLDRDGRPHVTDFGLAKRVQGGASLTQTGAILGTPSYMAPEQAAGSRGVLSPASDVYSLGAVLYELLTGRPPFQAASPVDTILLVLEQDLVPPRLLNPNVDRELEMICVKCLQKPAELRYATAAQVADDLEAFLRSEPVSARPSGLTYYVGRLFRDTHHAPVLENWGLLWMLHSVKILVICAITVWMDRQGIASHWPYLGLWSVGLVVWGMIFWSLRKRGGPVTFIERQIAHVWAAAVAGSISLFIAEWVHGMKVLTMTPGLAVIGGMVFLIKAGMLSGVFYFAALAFFVTSVLMALFPAHQLVLFALVSAACFFFPGLKYFRQRTRAARHLT